MLNEIYSIYCGLKAMGHTPVIRHKEIQEPGSANTTFRVMLDDNGLVVSVGLMTPDQIRSCWTLGNGNQNQFPAIKISVPLLPDAHDEYLEWKSTHKKPEANAYHNFINEMADKYPGRLGHIKVWPKYRSNILEKKLLLEGCDEVEPVYELYNRYGMTDTGVEILDQVREKIIEFAQNQTDLRTLGDVCKLLFGDKLKSNGDVDDSVKVTILLDCFPDKEIDIYASSREHVPALSRVLFDADSNSNKNKRDGLCFLSGVKSPLVSNKFYKTKVDFLSPILFSKSAGTSGPTVERYGRSGASAYQLSEKLNKELAWTIEYITSEKFRDITWAKTSTPGVLVAYCKDDASFPLAPLITGGSEINDFDDYLNATESVIGLFSGKKLKPDAKVDFIEMINVNKGNAKVIFNTTSTINHLVKSVESWKEACKNTPDFKLKVLLSNKENVLSKPWAISPKHACSVSRYRYIGDGSNESARVPGISFTDTMKLFLSDIASPKLIPMLRRVSEQYQPLLKRCALARMQSVAGRQARIGIDSKQKKLNAQALSAVTLMSVLLFKCGRTRTTYMNDFAFKLGQFCSAMDEMHIGYCVSERGGSIPRALLGNQVYGIALQDPIKALELMAMRRKPYDSWVARFRRQGSTTENKAIKSAIFAQKWMRENAESLGDRLKSEGAIKSGTYKAELMLGYLAGRPFNAKSQSLNSCNDIGVEK